MTGTNRSRRDTPDPIKSRENQYNIVPDKSRNSTIAGVSAWKETEEEAEVLEEDMKSKVIWEEG